MGPEGSGWDALWQLLENKMQDILTVDAFQNPNDGLNYIRLWFKSGEVRRCSGGRVLAPSGAGSLSLWLGMYLRCEGGSCRSLQHRGGRPLLRPCPVHKFAASADVAGLVLHDQRPPAQSANPPGTSMA